MIYLFVNYLIGYTKKTVYTFITHIKYAQCTKQIIKYTIYLT